MEDKRPLNSHFTVGVSFFAFDEIWYQGDVSSEDADALRGWYAQVVGLMGEQPEFSAVPHGLGDELEQRIKKRVYEAVQPSWDRLLDTIHGGWKHE